MGDPYGPRKLGYVLPFAGSTIKYGFMTNADSTTVTTLGITLVTAANPQGLVIGANAPKPARAVRKRASGSDSSFINPDKITAAKAAGWKIVSRGKVRTPASSTKSKTAYVVHEGNKIGWKMPMFFINKVDPAALTALGVLLTATSADLDICFGCSYPKLPRVGTVIFDSNGGSTMHTTFCDPSKLDDLPAGWSTVKASTEYVAPAAP